MFTKVSLSPRSRFGLCFKFVEPLTHFISLLERRIMLITRNSLIPLNNFRFNLKTFRLKNFGSDEVDEMC